MKDEEIDILEFLLTSDFNDNQYSRDQYIFFLKKYQTYYKILNAKYHGASSECSLLIEKTKKAEDQLLKEKRSNSIDKAKLENLKRDMKKKLSLRERIFGKLINRFDPDKI